MAASTVRVALLQIRCGAEKSANITKVGAAIAAAMDASARPELVVLPEVWNSTYATSAFPENAEPIPEIGASSSDISETESPSLALVLNSAREHSVFLIGGSWPEIGADGNIYNTCVVADPAGTIVAKHRKMHLFDIDIPGRQTFKESDTLSAGSTVSTFAMPQCVVGVGICYDMRFPEQAHLMRQAGAKLLVYPGAFNTTTGPMHWELLARGRAGDNQLWVAAASPARNPESEYQAWGHSTIVSPLGEVVATCDENEATVTYEIDIGAADEFRQNVPTWSQKRHDIYTCGATK